MKEADIFEMLIEHELAVGHLYEALAQTVKEREHLWRALAEDEMRHAKWLRTLHEVTRASKCSWAGTRLRAQAIRTSISYVEKLIERAKRGGFTLLQALSVAGDLENALLERQFSKLKDSAPAEIRPLLTRLAEETERHQKLVSKALDSERRRDDQARGLTGSEEIHGGRNSAKGTESIIDDEAGRVA